MFITTVIGEPSCKHPTSRIL